MVRRNKGLEFFRGRMVECKAEKGNRKRGKGLIDFKERKVGRVTTTQKNSAYFPNTIKFEKDLKTRRK